MPYMSTIKQELLDAGVTVQFKPRTTIMALSTFDYDRIKFGEKWNKLRNKRQKDRLVMSTAICHPDQLPINI